MLGGAPDGSRALEYIRHIRAKVLLVKAAIVHVKDELYRHVLSEGADGCTNFVDPKEPSRRSQSLRARSCMISERLKRLALEKKGFKGARRFLCISWLM